MLKIQRSANGQVVFKLSGRIKAENVKELRELLTSPCRRVEFSDTELPKSGSGKILKRILRE